jgi:hypothetical protein
MFSFPPDLICRMWQTLSVPDHGHSDCRKQAFMAGRILNRRELRRQVDEAGQAVTDNAAADAPAPAKAARKPRRQAPEKEGAASPVRQVGRIRWRYEASSDFRLQPARCRRTESGGLDRQKNAVHFLQLVKQPMAEPEPIEAPLAS